MRIGDLRFEQLEPFWRKVVWAFLVPRNSALRWRGRLRGRIRRLAERLRALRGLSWLNER